MTLKYLLFISRWPIFMIGAVAGYLIKTNDSFPKAISSFLIGISLVFLLAEMVIIDCLPRETLWNTGLYWIPFTLITPGLAILLSRGFERLKGPWTWVCTGISFIGGLSLEIYLIHIGIINWWKESTSSYSVGSISFDFVLKFLLFFSITLLLAFVLHFVICHITSNKTIQPSGKSR